METMETDMTEQKKPEKIADEDLDAAQGGFGTWGTTTSHVVEGQKKGDGFGTWGTATTTGAQLGGDKAGPDESA